MKVSLISVPFEGTLSGKKGASKGPEAILEMFWDQIDDYDCYLQKDSFSDIDFSMEDVISDNVEEMVSKVKEKVNSVEGFPIVIGGEHSVSIGAIDALKEDLTVLQIDAHLDMKEDNSDYSKDITKLAHKCVMKRAIDMGCKTLSVGIRSTSVEEMDFVKNNNLDVFFASDNLDINDIVSKIKTKNVYITIDADGFDPSVMPGVGTPVAGGLSWYFVLDLLKNVFSSKNVVGCDIVEVSPVSESNLTELNAAQLIQHIVGLKHNN